MKKAIYLSMFAGCLTTLGACDGSDYSFDSMIPDMYDKILYLQTTGKQELTLYDTGAMNEFSYSVIKSGARPELPASADVKVLSQEDLDAQYSEMENVNYRLLTEDAYAIENKHMDFTSEDRYKIITVSVDPDVVKSNMNAEPNAVWVLPLYVASDTDSINADRNSIFLQFNEIVSPAIQFSNTSVSVLEKQYGLVGTFAQEIPFGLDVENTSWDIACKFVVEPEYVDTYNAEHGTVFKALESNYVIESEQLEIPSGTTEMPLKVTIEGDNLEPGDYMLPIRLSETSLFTPKSGEDLYLLAFRILGTEFDRTGWSATPSSETVSGGTGGANDVLDDDINTYWHSKWDNGYAPLPHWLVIDTQTEHRFTQVALQRRIGYDYARAGYFYVSSDGSNWTPVGTFTMGNTDATQTFSITPSIGRYLKIEVTESANNNLCAAFAEVYLYGISE